MRTSKTASAILCIGLLVVPLPTSSGAKERFEVAAGQRQLFFDDYGVAEISNLTRTLHQPAKRGAVIKPDLSINLDAVQTRSAPSWDAERQVYRMWDCSSPDGMIGSSGYYESKDGLSLSPCAGQNPA